MNQSLGFKRQPSPIRFVKNLGPAERRNDACFGEIFHPENLA